MAAIFGIAAGVALLGSAGLIRLLHPVLVRYALARPNARSSHRVPTPQGGGIAVVAAALAAAAGPVVMFGGLAALPGFGVLCAAAIGLAIVGGIDDIRPLPAALRLVLQAAAVWLAISVADPGRILPAVIPAGLERALLVLAGTWWVNAVNFMDGIDWMTVVTVVPLAGTVAALGVAGLLPPGNAALAATLAGGLLGFAPANRPVARLFLGDVGSLPIGLLTGSALLALASAGHPVAALILPLYYLGDATTTLLRRVWRRERFWEAHRSHFYQRALDHGFTVLGVDARVLGLNLTLCALAAASIRWPVAELPALILAILSVAWMLRTFATPRSA